MIEKQWIYRDVNGEEQVALARALSISQITASVLLGRGVKTSQQARSWLSPHHTDMHDPFLLPDMKAAIERLHRAVLAGERICFYGDYDVDGIAATSLYLNFFGSLGCDVLAHIPHRLREGYGLNEAAFRHLRGQGVTVVVTSDCGTTAHREVEAANRLGLDVIVSDHHQVDGQLPPALAVINPCRSDSAYPFRGLCSAGLAYKVVRAYQTAFAVDETDPDMLLDLVALATIADVVPLQDENRLFVREGLALVSRGMRCGIRALKQVAGVDRDCTADMVAFRLAPRINAAGRLAHAETAVRLFTTRSDSEAGRIADELERLNRERQRLEEETTAEAFSCIGDRENRDLPAGVVVAERHWHLGVVGIVAARLAERYHRPAVVVAINAEGIGKGSARSVPGFDLYRALAACRNLLEAFGGHPAAAGLTIRESRLAEFRSRFAEVAETCMGPDPSPPQLHIDADVHLRDVGPQLIRELHLLNPFGAGNPEPVLTVRKATILQMRVVGEKHLKLTVRHGQSVPFDSIGFRMGSRAEQGLSANGSVDLAFVPELNRWNGLDRVQLRIKDLKVC